MASAANWLNLTTPLGLVIARATCQRIDRWPDGVFVGSGCWLRLRGASAMTIGNVIVTPRDASWLAERDALVRHEKRHVTQYAVCGGLFFVFYAVAAALSLRLRGNHYGLNPLERWADLEDGGYLNPTKRDTVS